MSFFLTSAELQRAFEAIEHHGYSALLPEPKEWAVVRATWKSLRAELTKLDLDLYTPCLPLRIYAPKSRINLRAVTLLHPSDLILYTAMTLLIKNDIEIARIPKSKRRVFSYRVARSKNNRLYEQERAYSSYQNALRKKATHPSHKFVAITDIADFYPRIYQHRLKNVIETVATTPRNKELGRVLVDKFINSVSSPTSKDSYGIPVGPLASRLLAEAVLIDVDSKLLSCSIDFIRWVDDFSLFAKTGAEAQYALFILGEWLFENHGLTLQVAKTHILTIGEYLDRLNSHYEDKLLSRSKQLQEWWQEVRDIPYDDTGTLGVKELEEIEDISLKQVLEEAVSSPSLIDYGLTNFILGTIGPRLPDSRKSTLIEVVLENLEALYPSAESVAKFFMSFEHLSSATRRHISKALIGHISRAAIPPPPYFTLWMLTVFADAPHWNQGDELRTLFDAARSSVVKRYTALALAVNGTRSHALALKPAYAGAEPLVRTAISLAARNLGADERKHWQKTLGLQGLEALIANPNPPPKRRKRKRGG